MKYLFYFISFIFPALCSSAQPAERDSSIYIASSRLYRMGESLVVSMQVDITRQIPSNESVILVPRLSDSLDNFIQLPAIIRKSKFPQNPKRSVRFLGKGTKRSVQKRKARNTQKAETKVL